MEHRSFNRLVFVYANLTEYRVMNLDTELREGPVLRADGWTHSATLDPARWIEALLKANGSEERKMIDELKGR